MMNAIFLSACRAASDTAPQAQLSALHEAIERNDPSTVKALIQNRQLLETRDDRGRTPLMVATHVNQVEVARLLIEAGANVNAKDAIQDSPYLYAGARGLLEILQLTLKHGANLQDTNRYGGTALIPACERGHVEAVRLLIAAGVNVDHVNHLGWTCLLEAVLLSDGGPSHRAIVQQLIDAKANLNLPDKNGMTALAHARQRRQLAMAELLEKAGAR